MDNKKTTEELRKEIKRAEKILKIGGRYYHYKNPEKHYKIINFAIQEATNKVCVIYEAEYVANLIFARDLDNWLTQPVVNGKRINRFTEIR